MGKPTRSNGQFSKAGRNTTIDKSETVLSAMQFVLRAQVDRLRFLKQNDCCVRDYLLKSAIFGALRNRSSNEFEKTLFRNNGHFTSSKNKWAIKDSQEKPI